MINKVFILVCVVQFTVSCSAQVPGCTDPLANNYNSQATDNDGSCSYYPISVSPSSTFELSPTIKETSGLSLWDGYVWTHNDKVDTQLYGMDTTYGEIKVEFLLPGVINNQWEEISQDENYLYIGDFGNNTSGDRTDLHLLRVEKSSLKGGSPVIDTIWFSYNDQLDLNPVEANTTDFDCEAFVVAEDSIYLFTKQWTSVQTSVYVFPKTPGTYIARKKETYNIQGLITGATYLEAKKLIVLCGYTSLLYPFFYLLYDFEGYSFFSGNKRRVTVSLPFHQVEGIATVTGLKYYVSNELFEFKPVANNPQKLHIFDLNSLLYNYIEGSPNAETSSERPNLIEIFPNPNKGVLYLTVRQELISSKYDLIDSSARVVLSGKISNEKSVINVNHLASGFYTLRLVDIPNASYSIIIE